MIRLKTKRERKTRGFTIMEMVVAASTMVVVMLGVVQVFRISTTTVSQTTDAQEAYQQARGIFSAIERDLASLTADGYLRIIAQNQPAPLDGVGPYAGDVLILTTTGTFEGITIAKTAPAAEVVYTTSTKCLKKGKEAEAGIPANWFPLQFPWESTAHSIRKGILSRQAYLVHAENPGSPAQYQQDYSKATSIRQFSDVNYRYPEAFGYAWPYSADYGYTSNPNLLGWILATRVGEFKVEYLPAGGTWMPGGGLWLQGSADWPKALRVTVVIFGPGDKAPASDSPNFDTATNKFRGYVFQQIFSLRK